MRCAHKYVISSDVIRQYWEMLGIDPEMIKKAVEEMTAEHMILSEKTINDEQNSVGVRDLFECSPYYWISGYKGVTSTTEYLDAEIRNFIHLTCSFFTITQSEQEKKCQRRYIEAYYGILRTATNLNLIPEGSTDYDMYFKRLEYILYRIMRQLNSCSPEKIIEIYELIKRKRIDSLFELYKKDPNNIALVLILLGMNSKDLPDYIIFDKELYELYKKDPKKIASIVVKQGKYPKITLDNIVSDEDFLELYKKDSKTAAKVLELLNTYSKRLPDCNISNDKIIDENASNFMLQNLTLKTDYDVTADAFPLESFGIKKIEIPGTNVVLGIEKTNLCHLSDEEIKAKLRLQQKPFNRPSYNLCRKMTEEARNNN